MFFKKKKVMNDNMKDTNNTANENADNMAQDEAEDMMKDMLDGEGANAADWLFPEKQKEIDKLKAELEEAKDKHLRLIAEFENYKRRTATEKHELSETGGKNVIQSLLVVLDDMSRAEKQIETTTDITAIKEGITLVFNKFRGILHGKGLNAMEALNEEFNPDLHEALTEIPAPSEELKGKVLDVMDPGYYLKSKLIRHAKVIVGK